MTEEIEKMENAGLKVIALQYGTMDDLETWIRIISSLYQQEERGEELIDYFYAQVAEVSDRVGQQRCYQPCGRPVWRRAEC